MSQCSKNSQEICSILYGVISQELAGASRKQFKIENFYVRFHVDFLGLKGLRNKQFVKKMKTKREELIILSYFYSELEVPLFRDPP